MKWIWLVDKILIICWQLLVVSFDRFVRIFCKILDFSCVWFMVYSHDHLDISLTKPTDLLEKEVDLGPRPSLVHMCHQPQWCREMYLLFYCKHSLHMCLQHFVHGCKNVYNAIQYPISQMSSVCYPHAYKYIAFHVTTNVPRLGNWRISMNTQLHYLCFKISIYIKENIYVNYGNLNIAPYMYCSIIGNIVLNV